MANTKISQLTPNTNPTGLEEMVYAYSGTNGKMTLSTIKSFVGGGGGGGSYTPGAGIDITSDVISNTGVLSINSTAGSVQLKTINGNSIVGLGNIDTTTTYTEYDYSALQGPAQLGFHVPQKEERDAVVGIWIALGGGSTDGTSFGIALKLPFAGQRQQSSSERYQGGSGWYWSVTPTSSGGAKKFTFSSTSIDPTAGGMNRAYGFSIRCFKDNPVVPTLSWTKLYGTSIESGGIFWDSVNGLISLSSNGSDWITIQDKNLGATQVWESGNAITQSNGGYYYQRGNNNGFAFTGTVTTSSSTVDASSYGPGNYYTSSTFITTSGQNDWSVPSNDDLWGGVTGVVITQYDLYNKFQISGTTITVGGMFLGGIAGDILSGAYTLDTGDNSHIGMEHYLYIPTQTNSYSITAGTGVNNPFGVTLPSSTTKSCLIKFYCDSVSTMVVTDCLIAN